uniref:Uncharacterized protein n=1 Tax=Oryza nivara TaxID=4536 RepID=A0A0E0JBL1_ORYNI
MREAGSQSSFDTTCRAHDGPKEETRGEVMQHSYCDQLYCWCCFGRVHPQGFSAVATDQVGVEFVTLFSQSVMALAVTRGRFL